MSDQEPRPPGLAEWTGFPGLAESFREHRRKSPDPWAPIRVYLRTCHNINRWDLCDENSPAWDVFRVDFGLTPAEISELTPTLLGVLCSFEYRLRFAHTEEARQEVLREIGGFRDDTTVMKDPGAQVHIVTLVETEDIRCKLAVRPRSDAEMRIFLKALTKFPVPAQAPPIICSQAEIARFLGRSSNTTKLLETLTQQGIIRFEKGKRRTFKVWFADPDTHAKALDEIPKRRKS